MRSWTLSLVVLALLGAAPAWAQKRVALVVGNGAYAEVARLPNPPNDARRMETMLRERMGFEVVRVSDGKLRDMDQALERFSRAAEGAEVALFFYAGHGMEHDGQNRLVPVDAVLEHERDVERQTLALDQVMKAMRGARVRVLLLDACRNNPLAGRMVRSAGGSRSGERGLAPVENAGPGTVIAFATAPGRVASDGAGSNSPFTLALLAKLPQSGEDIRVVLGDVSDSVETATGGRQSPWTNFTGLRGRFLLMAGVAVVPAPVQQPVPPSAPARQPPPTTARTPPPQPVPPVAQELQQNQTAEQLFQRGYNLARGVGVEQNEAEGARYYRLAGDQGHATALAYLGFMYANGRGVARNEAEALRLYRLAANLGHALAQSNLGFMYATGRGVAQDDAEAVRLYRLAADQRFASAQNNLAFMYEAGRGVAKDEAEAIRLYRLAASQGNSDAQAALRRRSLTW